MDKFQAAFEILHFLSVVDGEISQSEIDVIVDFINSNYDNIEFEPSEVVDAISILDTDGMLEELKLAIDVFNNSSSATDKKKLLDFAYELIASDGTITNEEANLFALVCTSFGVDVERYMEL